MIGDISPDPSLPCIVYDAERASNLISDYYKKYNTRRSETVTDNEKSDFEFFTQGDWSLILHSRDPKKHIQHSHNDYGSPILKYKNELVIFDLGRTS